MIEYSLSLDASTIETVERRAIVLLDTSVWIDLADEKTADTRLIRDQIWRLHEDERILCPLSAPTVWELRKQSAPSLQRTASLMEKLSLNVSFRGLDEIFDSEITHFLDYLRTGIYSPLSTSEKFGTLFSYLSPSIKLNPGPAPGNYNEKILYDHCGGVAKSMSLTLLISLLGERSIPNVCTVRGDQEANRLRREMFGSAQRIRRNEIEYVARDIVIPKLNAKRSQLPIAEQLLITQRVKNLPRSKKYGSAIEHILQFMPALLALVDVHAATSLDTNRKDNPNDFFDREILIYGLSYSSVFAAFDGWISSVVQYCIKSGCPGIFRHAGSLQELDAVIGTLQ